MTEKLRSGLAFLVLLLPFLCGAKAGAVTIDELAGICEQMESLIVDISLEYEWYNIPPWTVEEAEAEMGTEMLIPKDGLRRFKLSLMCYPNEPNRPLFDRLLLEESTTLVTKDGNSWHNVTKQSYNGKIAKYLNIGGWPQDVREGVISNDRSPISSLIPSPLGFSVFRFGISDVTDKTLLSIVLRRKELVRFDNTIKEINGFNTIHVDFLQEVTKQVCIRIYFSVDHGYTPVRYEYISSGKLNGAIDVYSLQKVAKGLWFPSSGLISSSDDERSNAFQVIGSVLINQGLTAEDFDIEFPVGTEVHDEVQGREYIVKAPEQ
jgi:hypothetical protein